MKIDGFEVNPAFPCHKCGKPCWDRRPMKAPNGDQVLMTICPSCWTENDFVNGKAVQIAFVERVDA